jgi:multiple sugar transport system substrate-binding protein/raffinose/stachyose/melibiose transport system substrate-binding protein
MSVMLLGIPLAACRRAPSNEAGTGQPTAIPTAAIVPTEDGQVEVFYVSVFQGGDLDSPEELLLDQFEAAHPDVRIERSGFRASPSAYLNYLRQFPFTTVMAIPADYATRQAIEEGLFLDLTSILVDADLDEAYPDTFRAILKHEGREYFLPAFYSWFAIYYNKEIFDRYDLTPPEDWDEFLAVCETLSDNDVAPIVYAGDNRQAVSVWFDYLDMRLNGPEFHAALMEGEESYDDDRVGAVFDTWQSLVESGYVLENAWGLQEEESLDMVASGRAAMILAAGYQAPQGLGFFRFPIMNRDIPVGEVTPMAGYVILANSPRLAEAIELLSYLGSGEAQTRLTRQFEAETGLLPLHRDVDRGLFSPEMYQALNLVQSADYIRQPYFWCFDDNLLVPMSGIFRAIMLGRDYGGDLEKLERNRQLFFER